MMESFPCLEGEEHETARQERDPEELIALFNGLFLPSHRTILVRGDGEPFYQPGENGGFSQIIFANGYFSSALHEVAHWLVAGAARRRLADFGYWYRPDGRTDAQQAEFERVEVRPQALEWILSEGCGHPFRFSADNLKGEAREMGPFQRQVHEQVHAYLRRMPPRAARMLAACQAFYGTAENWGPERFPEPGR